MKKTSRINELTKEYAKLFLLLFFISACSPDNESQINSIKKPVTNVASVRQGDAEKGRSVYEKYCFYCHGREGLGNGAISIAVTPHPADFVGDKKRMAKSDSELIDSIANGVNKNTGDEEMAMPRWKDILTEEDMWNVLSYVRKLSKQYEESLIKSKRKDSNANQ